MKKIIYAIIVLVFMSGCTTLITAPIGLATSVVSGTIDIAGSAVGAVAGGDD